MATTIKATVEIFDEGPDGAPRIGVEAYLATEAAQEAVRFKFNPSGLQSVTRIKLLSALLVSEINYLTTMAPPPEPNPDAMGAFEILRHARQLAVDASMNAVLAATKGL